MDKHSVDYEFMNKKLAEKKYFKYNDVKDRLIKVAFDVVKFKDSDNIDGLWQVQSSDDGEVIVALYEENSPKLEAKSSWSAVADKTASYVHIFYKNEPVIKIAAKDLGMKKEDSVSFTENLPKVLAENAGIRSLLLNELSAKDKKSFITKYPELG